jgi:hypothetical protein
VRIWIRRTVRPPGEIVVQAAPAAAGRLAGGTGVVATVDWPVPRDPLPREGEGDSGGLALRGIVVGQRGRDPIGGAPAGRHRGRIARAGLGVGREGAQRAGEDRRGGGREAGARAQRDAREHGPALDDDAEVRGEPGPRRGAGQRHPRVQPTLVGHRDAAGDRVPRLHPVDPEQRQVAVVVDEVHVGRRLRAAAGREHARGGQGCASAKQHGEDPRGGRGRGTTAGRSGAMGRGLVGVHGWLAGRQAGRSGPGSCASAPDRIGLPPWRRPPSRA